MKRFLCCFVGCVGLMAWAIFQSPAQTTSASTAPDLSITATPSSGLSNAFYLGQSYVLSLTGAPANATFTLCAVFPSGTHSCTPNWGTTDASGNWSSPSTPWIAATTATGTWEEGVQFPAQSPPIYSNGINFTMAASSSGAMPALPVLPVVPPPPPSPATTAAITGIQGLSSSTGYTDGTALQDTGLVLYGVFGTSGNTVAIDGTPVSPTYVTYQSTSQINVSLVGIAVGSHVVAVNTTSLGATGDAPFIVTAATAPVSQLCGGLIGLPVLPVTPTLPRTLPGVQTTQPSGNTSPINSDLNSALSNYSQELQNVLSQINNPQLSPKTLQEITPSFPATILVTASSLNVRPAPNTDTLLSPQETLSAGTSFTAVNEVVGESVDGNDLWWVTPLCNYVWSGATTVAPSVAAAPVITSVEGYDATTKAYTDGIITPGTSIVLYGTNFGASGNTVTINGNIVPMTNITYQMPSQIKISLSSPAPLDFIIPGSQNTVMLTTSNGTATAPVSFNVLMAITPCVSGQVQQCQSTSPNSCGMFGYGQESCVNGTFSPSTCIAVPPSNALCGTNPINVDCSTGSPICNYAGGGLATCQAGTSCPPTGTITTGGYNCVDNSCDYVASGGEYSDATSCEAACGTEATQPVSCDDASGNPISPPPPGCNPTINSTFSTSATDCTCSNGSPSCTYTLNSQSMPVSVPTPNWFACIYNNTCPTGYTQDGTGGCVAATYVPSGCVLDRSGNIDCATNGTCALDSNGDATCTCNPGSVPLGTPGGDCAVTYSTPACTPGSASCPSNDGGCPTGTSPNGYGGCVDGSGIFTGSCSTGYQSTPAGGCSPVTGFDNGTGGYNCVDNSCVAVSAGGEYSDINSCQDGCGSETTTNTGSGYDCENGNSCVPVDTNAQYSSADDCTQACLQANSNTPCEQDPGNPQCAQLCSEGSEGSVICVGNGSNNGIGGSGGVGGSGGGAGPCSPLEELMGTASGKCTSG